MKKRKQLPAILAMKFSNDMKVLLNDFTVEEQIHIIKTFLKIIKILNPENEFKTETERYEKVNKIYINKLREKYRDRFAKADNIHISEYFKPTALMLKGIGNGELDFCTNDEFNNGDFKDGEQTLSNSELKALLWFINNYLSSNLSLLYNKPKVILKDNNNDKSKTRQIISEELGNIDKIKNWGYAFSNEKDYNIFLNLLVNYFEYKPYSIPLQTIKLKKDCKTRFAKALRPIHKELSNENKKLKTDIDFFNIIRVLNHFTKLTDAEIYQAITR